MGYEYKTERHKLFTEDGQKGFLAVRDHANRLLGEAGAFRMQEVISVGSGDFWEQMARVDRLVELGEIREITGSGVMGQYRVFVRA